MYVNSKRLEDLINGIFRYDESSKSLSCCRSLKGQFRCKKNHMALSRKSIDHSGLPKRIIIYSYHRKKKLLQAHPLYTSFLLCTIFSFFQFRCELYDYRQVHGGHVPRVFEVENIFRAITAPGWSVPSNGYIDLCFQPWYMLSMRLSIAVSQIYNNRGSRNFIVCLCTRVQIIPWFKKKSLLLFPDKTALSIHRAWIMKNPIGSLHSIIQRLRATAKKRREEPRGEGGKRIARKIHNPSQARDMKDSTCKQRRFLVWKKKCTYKKAV